QGDGGELQRAAPLAASPSDDLAALTRREAELAEAKHRAEMLVHDLQRSLDAMNLGVVILDPSLHTELVNRTFFDIWNVTPEDVPIGGPFRALMDVNRHNGVYEASDSVWEDYVTSRLDEIRR